MGRHALVIAGFVLALGCTGAASTSEETGEATGGEETDTDGLVGPVRATNACEAAPTVGVGRWGGSLRGGTDNMGGACGLGGPDSFLRVAVPTRADVRVRAEGVGFVPVVGVLHGACLERWDTHQAACTSALEAWVYDVPGGESLVVSIGADTDDPALLAPQPSEPPDPLEFIVDVALRPVLAAGAACGGVVGGRCETGTDCLDAGNGLVCTALAGDTCASADPISLDGVDTSIEIDPARLQTDAHLHGCGGARARERVLRLDLAPFTGDLTALEVRADHPDVVLAVRAPGCLADAEIACAAADPAGARVLVPDADDLASAGIAPYLFVEIPDSVLDDEPPFSLSFDFQGG